MIKGIRGQAFFICAFWGRYETVHMNGFGSDSMYGLMGRRLSQRATLSSRLPCG